jgi:hypothetical protein
LVAFSPTPLAAWLKALHEVEYEESSVGWGFLVI